jgi:hypothetical protein
LKWLNESTINEDRFLLVNLEPEKKSKYIDRMRGSQFNELFNLVICKMYLLISL